MSTLKGLPAVSDARLTSNSVSAASPVEGGTSNANTISVWSVIEFNVDGNKVIPLRINNSKTIDKTFKSSKTGSFGYCQGTEGEIAAITIKAKFDNPDKKPQKVKFHVEIKGKVIEGQGLTLIGKSDLVSVSTKKKEYTFTVNDFVVPIGFYKQNLVFTFRYEFENSVTGASIKSAPIYNFPLKPTLPWTTVKNKKNNPWTEVLDLLLDKGLEVIDNISDKTSKIKIATAITKIVNSKLGLIYERSSGETFFGKSTTTYELSKFLAHLKKQPNRGDSGRRVNCTDCACAVTTFANLLGCSLYNVIFGSYIGSDGKRGFYCNKVLTLRSDADQNQTWDYPFSDGSSGGFSYHEICMEGSFDYTSKIYDACLKVNRNVIVFGQDSYRYPLLPADTRFSSKNNYTEIIISTNSQYYIEWLVKNDPAEFNRAMLSGNQGKRSIR